MLFPSMSAPGSVRIYDMHIVYQGSIATVKSTNKIRFTDS
jgi:hypothetical protein